MGKVEKIVVLSVLFLIVLILAISLNSTPTSRDAQRDLYLAELERKSQEGSRSVASPSANEALDRLMGEPTGSNPYGSGAEQGAPESDGPGAPVLSDSTGPDRDAGFETLDLDPQPVERPSDPGPEVTQALGNLETPRRPGDRVRPRGTAQRPEARSTEGSAPGLLSSVVEASIPLQADWDLKTTRGMRPSGRDTWLIYTCAQGDTFESLAGTFYGSAGRARLLRLNNEGVDTLAQGDEILVPVQDDTGDLHQVAKNESLWAIANAHYGDGSRWREIFQANRHILGKPEDLRPGMELILP